MAVQVKTKEELEKLSRELRDAYYDLPVRIHIDVKKALMAECFWSESLFYTRARGERFIKDIEIPVIKRVFEHYGVKIFE